MWTMLLQADSLLRARPWVLESDHAARKLAQLGLLVAVFGMSYGAVMGSFGGVFGERFLQVVFSAVKVPLLLMGTFVLSLPSFFVVNTLFGLRPDFSHALRALLATQAGLTIVLASFAPFTVLWYASSSNYRGAILFNTLMFGCASFTAQWLLRRFYEPLIRRNPRHRMLLRAWLAIYAFVGIQMGWVLRPFIGNPDAPTQFFRQDAWGNAYVTLANILWRFLGG
ncbi:MAG: hypothetical protein A2Z25_11240 [Planctomycetes bacterium RBG_16_55_9]|nr:MAG: hypothetical protein A2Z25_11240 [Planctomycetes bacterium RBG_16_55_9]